MTKENVKQIFHSEFSCICEKFRIFEKGIKELENSQEDFIYHPGVYIYWKENRVLKVGRHLTNSRKRALEHISDNTKIDELKMSDLKECSKTKVLLFNVKEVKDYHWVAAVEIFLEKHLNPKIKSKRQG